MTHAPCKHQRAPIVIFDLDGTLANLEHRLHFIKNPDGTKKAKPDWPGFFQACDADKLIDWTAGMLHALYHAHYEIWVWSGRSSEVLMKSIAWLERHNLHRKITRMKFRAEGDYTPDDQLKEKWLMSLSSEEQDALQFVVDDRKRLVEMYRRHGVPVAQVAEGEF